MATFLDTINGYLKQLVPITTSSGTSDGNKIAQTDASGRFDVTLMPTSVTPQVKIVQAAEALTAGNYVNIYYDNTASDVRCRKADASVTGKYAHGFTKANVSSGADATIYLEGINDQVSGFDAVAGTAWLSATTPGGVVTTPPAGSGQVVQIVGTVLSPTEIDTEMQQPILLAT
ncbi:MAG: hypothetical protein BWK78_00395 [Thiotrichaceae bacterium IS1]|nr:MAG: hypothetical protein BWK78_00395 [Thiotrichaceae bacterium IS1]